MPLFILLLVLFWAVVPGLIAGWMLHERGRSFARGLLVGALCGPLGILGTLVFIYVSDRRAARSHAHGRGRAVRVFYEVPVVGRLHVSTVWALAGLATFLCAWMIGGIGYEFYRAGGREAGADEALTARGLQAGPKPGAAQSPSAVSPATDPKQATPAQGNNSTQARTALVGNIAAQPAQPGAPGVRAGTAPPRRSANGQP